MNATTSPDKLLSVREAASALGLSAHAVRKRIQRNTLRAFKVDGQWYIRLDATADETTRVPRGNETLRQARRVQASTRSHLEHERETETGEPIVYPPMSQPDSHPALDIVQHLRLQVDSLTHVVESLSSTVERLGKTNELLVGQVAQLTEQLAASASPTVPDSPSRPWWRLWRRKPETSP